MYDYAANDAAIEELCNDLKTAHDKLVGAGGDAGIVKEIFAAIDDLSSAWSGDSYNSFKEMCHSYEKPVYFLGNIIEAYMKLFESGGARTAADKLYTDGKTAIDEMVG